ncbi:hypothetical protein [Nonomuraea rubra]|uniref:hypothetical protein n=1 Tax=Nonomuraea rubra TaxID=46180 RepID=UPI00340C551A
MEPEPVAVRQRVRLQGGAACRGGEGGFRAAFVAGRLQGLVRGAGPLATGEQGDRVAGLLAGVLTRVQQLVDGQGLPPAGGILGGGVRRGGRAEGGDHGGRVGVRDVVGDDQVVDVGEVGEGGGEVVPVAAGDAEGAVLVRVRRVPAELALLHPGVAAIVPGGADQVRGQGSVVEVEVLVRFDAEHEADAGRPAAFGVVGAAVLSP